MKLKSYIDAALDSLNGDPEEKILILTDSGWPVSLYPREIQVHTPYLTVSDEFGLSYQSGIAQMVHGETGIRVKKPYIGQMIYLWSNKHWAIISPRQKVLRIYNNKELAKVTPFYIKNLMDNLDHSVWISEMEIIPGTKSDNPINFILAQTMGLITDKLETEWKLTERQSEAFPTVAKMNGDNPDGQDVFFHSGYVYQKGKSIWLTNASVALLMEAIHRRFPMKTHFDENGIIHLVENQK